MPVGPEDDGSVLCYVGDLVVVAYDADVSSKGDG